MWFVLAAQAATPAYYHPDDVSKKSAAFSAVADSMGPAFEERDGKARAAGAAVASLELGVALLGDAAPASLVKWTESTRRTVNGQFLRLQKHVDLLQEDYSRVFMAALDRAKPAVLVGYDAKECAASGIIAMMGRTTCEGQDLNAGFAAIIDRDAVLAKDLADIAGVEWPSVDAPSAPQEAVALTGTARWVDGGALAQAVIPLVIEARRDKLEGQLDAVLEDGNTAEAVAKAKTLRAAWQASLADDGARLRGVVVPTLERLAKKGGPAEVAWCANPVALGGCPGENATKQVIAALREDKKFGKEIAAKVPVP